MKKRDNILRLKYRKVKHFIKVCLLRLLNPKATHLFFFSEQQNQIGRDCHVYFKGKEYSECREFRHGWFSNWDDAVLLGIGTNDDIEF